MEEWESSLTFYWTFRPLKIWTEISASPQFQHAYDPIILIFPCPLPSQSGSFSAWTVGSPPAHDHRAQPQHCSDAG